VSEVSCLWVLEWFFHGMLLWESDLFWGAAGDWCGDQVREIEMWLGRGKGFGLVTFGFVAVIGLEGAFDSGTIWFLVFIY
jgi:hypothetical protein